jgi:hypothetical protein
VTPGIWTRHHRIRRGCRGIQRGRADTRTGRDTEPPRASQQPMHYLCPPRGPGGDDGRTRDCSLRVISIAGRFAPSPTLDGEQRRRCDCCSLDGRAAAAACVPQGADIVAAPVAAQVEGLGSTTGVACVSGPVYGTEGHRFESCRARFQEALQSQIRTTVQPQRRQLGTVGNRTAPIRRGWSRRGIESPLAEIESRFRDLWLCSGRPVCRSEALRAKDPWQH